MSRPRSSIRRLSALATALFLEAVTPVVAQADEPRTFEIDGTGPAATALARSAPRGWRVGKAAPRGTRSAPKGTPAAVVTLGMEATSKGRRVTILVRTPDFSAYRDREVMLGKNLSHTDGKVLSEAVGPMLDAVTTRAPAPAPTPQAEASPPAAPRAPAAAVPELVSSPPADVAASSPPTPLEAQPEVPVVRLALAAGVATRSFTYRDGLSPNLRSYDLAGTPTLGFGAESFPLAGRAASSALGGLGVFGGATFAAGLSSAPGPDAAGEISTRWSRWIAGVRALVPIAGGRVRVGGSLAFGREVFAFGESALAQGAPAVAYAYLRPAIEARGRLGPVVLEADAAFLAPLGGGAFEDRARGASVAGVEGGAGARLALSRRLDVAVLGSYTRWFYAFSPEPGDVFVAGGAIDQSLRGALAVAGRY